PNLLRQRLARNIEQAIGGADGDRQSIGKRKEPLDGTVHNADDVSQAHRRSKMEMGVDDGAKLGRRLQAKHQVRRDYRRDRKDHLVVINRQFFPAEVEDSNPTWSEIERTQAVSELDFRVAVGKKAQRRLDEDGTKPVASNERAAGLSSHEQCFADDGAGQPRARL